MPHGGWGIFCGTQQYSASLGRGGDGLWFVRCTCPEKMDTKKRLDWLTYLELFDKQNVSSFSCW